MTLEVTLTACYDCSSSPRGGPQGQLPQVQTAKKLLYTNNANDTNKHNHVY